MAYSDKVVDHFNNPRNMGSFKKDEEGVGTGMVGAPECGDVMKLQIKVQGDTIVDAKFKTFGCGSAIASSSLATEWLKGKTIGSPEWAHTAAVYMRGWLNDEHGVGLKDINWVQAGANEPGRIEKVELNLPKSVKLTRIKDKSLSEMVASGEIDCALIARPPDCFRNGHPDVVRLFPDFWEMEEKYYKAHKVWPIMHIISMQKKVLDENPWVARNMLNAFNESKRRSVERLMDPAVSRYPVAWLPTYMRKMSDLFGGDTFPYGIEENRPTWEQMLLYTHQQGIAHRHAKPEELFPKGVMTNVVV